MKSEWGPCLWHILHTIAKNTPKKLSPRDVHYAKQLINTIAYIIPCFKCQKHYMTNIIKNKPVLNTNENFFKWTVKIHNIVNKSLGKEIIPLTSARHITEHKLSHHKIDKLLVYLRNESSNYNISSIALIRFINVIKYFYKYCQ